MQMAPMSAIDELATLGRSLGAARWVQGPGGNVSVKTDDGELWVKASGTLLHEVATSQGHARVSLETARRALAGDAMADAELFARTPRPSLETYFHALPGRVVAHVHALGAMLYACSSAPYAVRPRPGLVAIPYVRPGRAVALAIRDVAPQGEHVCVLRSHGIVAYAESAARAVALLEEADAESRATFGVLPDIDGVVAAYLASPVEHIEGGVVRKLPVRTLLESSPPRYLFPDAAVCAGVIPVETAAPGLAARALAASKRASVLVDGDGHRVAVARSEAQLRQTCEVTAAHDWLEDALRARGLAQYLPEDEPAGLLDMPSEQYRIGLAAHARG